MKCAECLKDFPPELLSSMFINGGHTKPICGICALEITNKFHGTSLKEFQGEVAQEMYEKAMKHIGRF